MELLLTKRRISGIPYAGMLWRLGFKKDTFLKMRELRVWGARTEELSPIKADWP